MQSLLPAHTLSHAGPCGESEAGETQWGWEGRNKAAAGRRGRVKDIEIKGGESEWLYKRVSHHFLSISNRAHVERRGDENTQGSSQSCAQYVLDRFFERCMSTCSLCFVLRTIEKSICSLLPVCFYTWWWWKNRWNSCGMGLFASLRRSKWQDSHAHVCMLTSLAWSCNCGNRRKQPAWLCQKVHVARMKMLPVDRPANHWHVHICTCHITFTWHVYDLLYISGGSGNGFNICKCETTG